jgi:hypothetical protein
VVESAHTRECHDAAGLKRLDLAFGGGVRLQGHVRPVGVIVVEVLSENSSKVSLVQHDHVVETLSTDRADDSLSVRILVTVHRISGKVGALSARYPEYEEECGRKKPSKGGQAG